MDNNKFSAGLAMLNQPVLPLVRLVQILFLTGPFSTVNEVVAELHEPIETNTCFYDNPQKLLEPYLGLMGEIHRLKDPQPAEYIVFAEDSKEAEFFEAIELMTAHQVMVKELEQINSLLCGPCRCTLCCTGPSEAMSQLFFEIPLSSMEIKLFPLPVIDSPKSRSNTPDCEPPLQINGRSFYESGTAIYNWQDHSSLILPRGSSCPQLQPEMTCAIYPQRPNVCRRPQIFSYVLERIIESDQKVNDHKIAAYQAQSKVLAIWDCPYVKEFKQEIAAYAEMCELEPVFKENKN